MADEKGHPATVDEYIAQFPQGVEQILSQLEEGIELRLLVVSLLLGVVLAGCSAWGTVTPSTTQANACPVTEPALLTPPEDAAVPNAPVAGYYFVNDDQSIWAAAGDEQEGKDSHWLVPEQGRKVGWFRPAGATLEITGRRLDGEAPALQAEVPCCYPTRFQATGLIFPSDGCWEVTAKAGDRVLSFVVRVERSASP